MVGRKRSVSGGVGVGVGAVEYDRAVTHLITAMVMVAVAVVVVIGSSRE